MLPRRDASLLPVLQPLSRAEIHRDHRDWYHSAKRLMNLTALEFLSACGKDFSYNESNGLLDLPSIRDHQIHLH